MTGTTTPDPEPGTTTPDPEPDAATAGPETDAREAGGRVWVDREPDDPELAGQEPGDRVSADQEPGGGPQTGGGTAVTDGPRHARVPRTAGDYARALGRRLRAQAPLAVVLAVVVVAFWRIGLQHWREGTTMLGLALLVAAVLRVALPDRTAGLLAVRPRRTDVLTYAAFGVVVVLVSLTITGGPLASR